MYSIRRRSFHGNFYLSRAKTCFFESIAKPIKDNTSRLVHRPLPLFCLHWVWVGLPTVSHHSAFLDTISFRRRLSKMYRNQVHFLSFTIQFTTLSTIRRYRFDIAPKIRFEIAPKILPHWVMAPCEYATRPLASMRYSISKTKERGL